MRITIEVEVNGEKPVDATHFIPENETFYACWVKDGYSMRVGTQNEWVSDEEDGELSLPHAFKIV